MTRVAARLHAQASTLACAIDKRVRAVTLTGDRCTLRFANGQEALGTVKGDITELVLAALGHTDFRGIRSGLGDLLEATSGVTNGAAEFASFDGGAVVTLHSGAGSTRAFTLIRDASLVAPPYPADEFARVHPRRLTERAPGRALAPLPVAVWQRRAAEMLGALHRRAPEELFALPPLMVVMGLTDRCNHRCPFCFRQRDPAYAVSALPVFTDANITRTILSLAEAGVRAVRLCGEGEDTTHPYYLKYLLLARACGLSVMQITNGSNLRTIAPVIARCTAFLRVSINGWNARAYARNHGLHSLNAFERVLDGVHAVAQERATLSPGGTAICISSVIADGSFRADEFAMVMATTRADVAVLKADRECSRASTGDMVRLRIHGGKEASPSIHPETAGNSPNLLVLLEQCRSRCPDAFREAPGPLIEQSRDWITDLRLGCVLRYLRVEIERFELFNCSLLHESYGTLAARTLERAWRSSERKTGIARDRDRAPVLCANCGWGDLFRLANHFFDEGIAIDGLPPAMSYGERPWC